MSTSLSIVGNLNGLALCFTLAAVAGLLLKHWRPTSLLGCAGTISSGSCMLGALVVPMLFELDSENRRAMLDCLYSSAATLAVSAAIWWKALRRRLAG